MTDTLIQDHCTLPLHPPAHVWLKSEWLDLKNEVRFGTGAPDYDSASWTLRKSEPWRRYEPAFDTNFDWHVKNAWLFPWRFSKSRLEPCYRRSLANFVIRHIGHWSADAERFDAKLSVLSRPLSAVAGRPIRRTFALTPFSIIVQDQMDEVGPQSGSEIVHTEILFFYTFESFVQEAMAQNAYDNGVDVDLIVKGYQHVYTNTQPDAVLLRDPGDLDLSSLVGPSFSWRGIRDHLLPQSLNRRGGTKEDQSPRLREILFFCRLQAHLMVAITAACHGVASFFRPDQASLLVEPLQAAPTIDELAPFWLRHLFGAYEHPTACISLLNSLARGNGHSVTLGSDGWIVPGGTGIRTEVEQAIGSANSPFGHDDTAEVRDTFRFGLFETAIDDEALTIWIEKVRDKLAQRRGY